MERKELKEGEVFGKLTVIKCIYNYPAPAKVKVKCECGATVVVLRNSLVQGKSKQCFSCARIEGAFKKRTGFGEISGSYWATVKANAKTRNIDFLITPEYAYNLFLKQEKRCAISGVELSFRKFSKNNIGTASLDRIKTDRPYEEGNVQWLHKDVNRMKWDFTQETFIKICRVITEYQKTKIYETYA